VRAGGSWRFRLCRAGIDAQHFGDLWSSLSVTCAHEEGRAKLQNGMADSLNGTDVQEGLAGAIGELDKAEALLRIEPLHTRLGLRTRGDGRTGSGACWSISERGLRLPITAPGIAGLITPIRTCCPDIHCLGPS
jgi:hypothetical protein